MKNNSAANNSLAFGGIPYLLDSFVFTEVSVLRTNLCAEKSANRKIKTKRYRQC